MKIGNYTIPDLRLFAKIIETINIIYQNYHIQEAEDEDAVARLCGHKSANSGAWYSKLADMRLYGLLEPRSIKLTSLAEKLLHGTESQKQEAINKAILNVPLWKEVYNRFDLDLPINQFWVQLQEITGLDPLEAQKYAETVRKSYLDDIKYLKMEVKEENELSLKFDANSEPITAQANIVRDLIIQRAFSIAKDFIDFIEEKANREKDAER